jgi:hypothetical protein
VINERRSRENGIDKRVKRQIVRQRVIERASGSRRLEMGRADGSVGTDVYCATMYSSTRRVSSVSFEGDVESWIDLSLSDFLHVVSVNNGHERMCKYDACMVARALEHDWALTPLLRARSTYMITHPGSSFSMSSIKPPASLDLPP